MLEIVDRYSREVTFDGGRWDGRLTIITGSNVYRSKEIRFQ
jgi:hypothetical protein